MDRALWIQSLTKFYAPPWPCPTCKRGTYILDAKSFVKQETTASRKFRGHDEWGPEAIDYAFTAWLKCNNPDCSEVAVVSGVGGMEQYWNDDEGVDWAEYFAPRYCFPMPNFFELPKKCPREISLEMESAFAHFWSDPSAATGRIRVALERLMDHLSVPSQGTDKKGRPFELTLHGRLEAFAKIDSTIASQAMALKWLGNTGSHGSTVKREEALTAFEIMEHILAETIDQRTNRIKKLAEEITRQHDPKLRKPKSPPPKRATP